MTDFVIIQSGDQVEPQSKSAAAVAIPLRDDAKDFQMPNHVLDQYSLPRQKTNGSQTGGANDFPAFSLSNGFVFLSPRRQSKFSKKAQPSNV